MDASLTLSELGTVALLTGCATVLILALFFALAKWK